MFFTSKDFTASCQSFERFLPFLKTVRLPSLESLTNEETIK